MMTRPAGRVTRARSIYLIALALGLLVLQPVHGASFEVQYADAPGSGFLDDTVIEPVPGNPGTTLGQQRRNVVKHAATIWGAILESDVEILIEAAFSAGLPCSGDSAVLGGATTQRVFSDFPGAPESGVWYPSALADALAGEDLCAQPGNRCAGEPDIVALFNANLEGRSTCLGGRHWYYGLDHDSGSDLDFLNVLLHEMAHGLGFQTFADKVTGENFGGKPSVYDLSVLDLSVMLTWREMSANQRRVSATNDTRIVWQGNAVTAASDYLDASGKADGKVMLYAPGTLRPGSSISHWDSRSRPDALMEPRFNQGLTGSRHLDLTPCLLNDLGWRLGESDACFSRVPDFASVLSSTAELDFGTTRSGEVSSLTMRLENSAILPFDIGSIRIAGDANNSFQTSSDSCSQTRLAHSSGCDIELTFYSSDPGTYLADLFVPSSDSTAELKIPIRGTVTGAASVDPSISGGKVLGESSDSVGGTGGGGALFALLPLLLPLGMRHGARHRETPRGSGSGTVKRFTKRVNGCMIPSRTTMIAGEDVHDGDWPAGT